MSLINVRRERRSHGARSKRPPSVWKLLLLLVGVVTLIWYFGTLS